METKAVYMFDRDELEAHDKKLIEETAVRTVKAMKEYIFKEPTPEWVTPKWIYDHRFCAIGSPTTFQSVRKQIEADPNVDDGLIFKRKTKRVSKVNTKQLEAWIEARDEHKARIRKMDIRQRLGVV